MKNETERTFEYTKIANVFKFDQKYRTVLGLTDICLALGKITWEGTEKIDGTNIRVIWDGHEITFMGRTDKSVIPTPLLEYLTSVFKTNEMEYVFEQLFGEKEVILFGEGYGPKIQANGELYGDTVKFILFDVVIENNYLLRADVNDIANKLGLDSVPILFNGTIDEAIAYVSQHHESTRGEKHEMEGLVLEPKGIRLYDSKGHPIKCKCKYRDIVKCLCVNSQN